MMWPVKIWQAKRPAVLAALRRIARRRDPVERERALVAASGLLDESYYLIQAPDVHEAGADPIDHFCRHGWREGRRPNACFDPAWYRELYLADAPDVNPLVHYIRKGRRPAAARSPISIPPGTGGPMASRPRRRRCGTISRTAARSASRPTRTSISSFISCGTATRSGPTAIPSRISSAAAPHAISTPRRISISRAYRQASMETIPSGPQTLSMHEMRVPLVHYLDAQARAAKR